MLVLVPVVLIKRGRTVGEPIPAGMDEGEATRVITPEAPVVTEDAGAGGPRVSEIAIQGCAEIRRGESCDRPAGLDQVVSNAVRDSASCVPRSAPGGALPLTVELSFAKKKPVATVALAKDGRTLKDPKVAQKCGQRLKERIEASAADLGKHERVRYKLAFMVTYPAGTE